MRDLRESRNAKPADLLRGFRYQDPEKGQPKSRSDRVFGGKQRTNLVPGIRAFELNISGSKR